MTAHYPFKNLVFQGGGVLGVCYAGAVRVLHEEGILEQVERVAGTSAGAIASLLLALRYDVDHIEKVLLKTDFKQFTTEAKPLEFRDRYGWDSVRPLHEWFRNHIKSAGEHLGREMTGDETFADFQDLGCRGIKVFATDLNTRSVAEFHVERTPHIRVVDAVCASLSIPAFFQSFQFPDGKPNKHIYVDGGALLNYPIMAFDPRRGNKVNQETIGFSLEENDNLGVESDLGYGTFRNWAEHLYETVKRVQLNLLNMHEEHKARTVFIDVGTISPVDFEITLEQKQELIENGRRATQDYLQWYRYKTGLLYRTLKTFGLVGRASRN